MCAGSIGRQGVGLIGAGGIGGIKGGVDKGKKNCNVT